MQLKKSIIICPFNYTNGNKGILPELQIITDGQFKGFITVNPRWAGFKAQDYIHLSESVCGEDDTNENTEFQVSANNGEFDFRGFEIARSQFFNNFDKISITMSVKKNHFFCCPYKKAG